MAYELFVPGVGLAYFGGALSESDLDETLKALCEVAMPERAEHFTPFELQDAATGLIVRGLQYLHAPLSALDMSRLLASAVRAFPGDVALRAKWMRQSASLIAVPGSQTRCGYCASCDSELPPSDLFGYCAACKRAAIDVAFNDDDSVTLRGGVN